MGWRRVWRILTVHSTAAVEIVAAIASILRGLGLLWNDRPFWPIAVALILVGYFQIWGVKERRPRLRALAAVLTMLVVGVATKADLLTWPAGYAGAMFPQAWIFLRAGPLFKRLENGHARH